MYQKVFCGAAILCICLCGTISPPVFAGESETVPPKICVLGVECALLTDVQERVLRETAMRELFSKGFLIVPIMQIEYLMQHETIDIRSMNNSQMQAAAKGFGARYVLSGQGVIKEKQLVYKFTLYDLVLQKETTFYIPIDKNKSFYEYCPQLAVDLADNLTGIAKNN